MKRKIIIPTILLMGICIGHGQGTFVLDQESTNLVEGALGLQSGQPMGHSFTPSFSSVGVVALNLYDGDTLHTAGATVFVNLRWNSITGPILGVSDPVFMPNNFFGITNFVFSTPVAVVPGVTYYFQPLVQSGDGWGSYLTDGSYPGGTAIAGGLPISDRNLWFREGIVPEPSSAVLFLSGVALAACRRLRNARSNACHDSSIRSMRAPSFRSLPSMFS